MILIKYIGKLIKKFLIFILIVFIIINITSYISSYVELVKNIPKKYQEARFDLNNAYFVSIYYEQIPMALHLVDYNSKILTPIRTLKRYFYKKGLENLPHNSIENAVWYYLINLYPISIELKKKNTDRLSKVLSKTFTQNIIEESYENIKFFTKDDLEKEIKNKKLPESLITIFLAFYSVVIEDDFYLLQSENIQKTIRNDKKIEKLTEVYLTKLAFFNKKIFKDDLEKHYKSSKPYINALDIKATSIILENILLKHGSIPETKEYQLIYKKHLELLNEREIYKKTKNYNLIKVIENEIQKEEINYPNLKQLIINNTNKLEIKILN